MGICRFAVTAGAIAIVLCIASGLSSAQPGKPHPGGGGGGGVGDIQPQLRIPRQLPIRKPLHRILLRCRSPVVGRIRVVAVVRIQPAALLI